MGLPVITHQEFRMVGGASDSADIARAQVHWLGEVRRVSVIVKEAYLLGAALLARHARHGRLRRRHGAD